MALAFRRWAPRLQQNSRSFTYTEDTSHFTPVRIKSWDGEKTANRSANVCITHLEVVFDKPTGSLASFNLVKVRRNSQAYQYPLRQVCAMLCLEGEAGVELLTEEYQWPGCGKVVKMTPGTMVTVRGSPYYIRGDLITSDFAKFLFIYSPPKKDQGYLIPARTCD